MSNTHLVTIRCAEGITPVQLAVALQSLLGRAAANGAEAALVGAVVDIPQPAVISEILTEGQIIDVVNQLPRRRRELVVGAISTVAQRDGRRLQFAVGAAPNAGQLRQQGASGNAANSGNARPKAWKPKTLQEYQEGCRAHDNKSCRGALLGLRNALIKPLKEKYKEEIPSDVPRGQWHRLPCLDDRERRCMSAVEEQLALLDVSDEAAGVAGIQQQQAPVHPPVVVTEERAEPMAAASTVPTGAKPKVGKSK